MATPSMSESTEEKVSSRVTQKNSIHSEAKRGGASDPRDKGREEDAAKMRTEYETAALSNLMVDDANEDPASGTVEELALSDVEIKTSGVDNVVENGRTYHKHNAGAYFLPNDEKEKIRLNLQHRLCTLTLHGKSHLAPIKPHPEHVLDFGTGTGIWATEFAAEYPMSKVLGTDLSPVHAQVVPANCQFEVADADEEWLFPQKFDYIHSRLLAFGLKDPAAIIKKAYDSLTPGGYLEMFDAVTPLQCIDESLTDTALEKFSTLMSDGAKMIGRDLGRTHLFKAYFGDAGFEDVVVEHFQWPINTWPRGDYHKSLGRLYNRDIVDGLSGIAMAICTRVYKMTPDEIETMLVDVRRDFKDTGIHAYQPIMVVYGRRP